MIILKVIITCIISLILILFLKNTSPQFAICISILAGTMITIYMVPYIKQLFLVFLNIGNDIKELNEFLDSINTLHVVEVESVKEFSDSIIHKDQALYYMMADQSIKDAIKSEKSEPYFGFTEIESKTSKEIEDNINLILKQNIFPTYKASAKNNKKRYFLNFTGDGVDLFNILHNDFKTEMFNKSDDNYIDNISTENKENILKLIYKNFKIGKGVITKFAEYLVRLEAHMLLKPQDPFFVVKNNVYISTSLYGVRINIFTSNLIILFCHLIAWPSIRCCTSPTISFNCSTKFFTVR